MISLLPWNLAFRLIRFTNYYSSLQSISAIYHTLLAHLHKKPSLHHQNRKRTDSEEQTVQKGAQFKIQRENEVRMLVLQKGYHEMKLI